MSYLTPQIEHRLYVPRARTGAEMMQQFRELHDAVDGWAVDWAHPDKVADHGMWFHAVPVPCGNVGGAVRN